MMMIIIRPWPQQGRIGGAMDLRRSYREEMALVRGWSGWLAVIALTAALAVLPFLL